MDRLPQVLPAIPEMQVWADRTPWHRPSSPPRPAWPLLLPRAEAGVRPVGPGRRVTRTPDAPLIRDESAQARILKQLWAPHPQVLGPDTAVAVSASDFGFGWCLQTHVTSLTALPQIRGRRSPGAPSVTRSSGRLELASPSSSPQSHLKLPSA